MAETRASFLQRVRDALRRTPGQPVPPPPEVDDALVRLARADPGLFAERAGAAGAAVHRVLAAGLPDALVAILRKHDARRVAVEEGLDLEDALRAAGLDLVDWRASRNLDALFDADAGVTGAYAAVSESGSVVLQAGARTSRGLWLVPPVHVAILPARALRGDLLDCLPDEADLPSARVLVTGPSKTADIEGVLVRGVHGPGAVHMLLVEDA